MKQIFLMIFVAMNMLAADASGKWTGTMTVSTPDGVGKAMPALLVLKQDGDKLTGTAGPDENERHDIENGNANNGSITFQVPTGNAIMKFNLKHEGEEITGEITREREGQTQTAKLALKRVERP
jgi:hypothetical protein